MSEADTTRDPFEELAAEFTERYRRGECPSVSEYVERHPDLAEEIRELFPTIVTMEGLRARHEQPINGLASLGAVKPDRLGDFRIIREIGRGGMGVVYEAEHESLGRRVAIKVLPKQSLLDPKALARFEREARIAANLHHTNIVEVFGVGVQDGLHYYVMQYVGGVGLDKIVSHLAASRRKEADAASLEDAATELRTPEDVDVVVRSFLEDLSSEGGGRPGSAYWRRAAVMGLQVAEALGYAHEQGTLHRDIKPGNLLIDGRGSVWVTDFGLAKAIQTDDATVSADVSGTLRYMAPEQFRGEADARSEIYSLGLTLFELLALQPAYGEGDRNRLIHCITQGEPARLREACPHIPRDLETIVLKATARDPARRYGAARELADDLQRFLEDRPIEARRATACERLWRWCRRNPTVAALTGTTMLLIALIAVVASIGYVRTKDALEGEERERERSEATATLAQEALDRIFERLSPIRVGRGLNLTVDSAEGTSVEVPSPPALSPNTAELLGEMLVFYDRLAKQATDDVHLLGKVAEANRRVGDIRQRLGQHEEAAAAYAKAIRLYETLSRRFVDGDATMKIAAIHNELGRICRLAQELERARGFHLKALSLLQSVSNGSPAVRHELARSYYFLGTRPRALPVPPAGPRRPGAPPPRLGPLSLILGPPGPPPGGVGRAGADEYHGEDYYLEQAIRLLTDLVRSHADNPEYRHLLALCHRERFFALAPRSPESALDDLHRATEILEQLVKDFPDVPDYRHDLSETYAEPDARHPLLPGFTRRTVEERLRKALEISEALVGEHPHIPEYVVSQAHLYHKLADTMRHPRLLAEAERNHRKAVALQVLLVKQFPEVSYHRVWLGIFRSSLADVLWHTGRLSEARALFEDSIELLSNLLKEDADLWFLHGVLAKTYRDYAAVLERCGEKDLALEAELMGEAHHFEMRDGPLERPVGKE